MIYIEEWLEIQIIYVLKEEILQFLGQEVSNSRNKKMVQQYTFQKVWKILLLPRCVMIHFFSNKTTKEGQDQLKKVAFVFHLSTSLVISQ